jgi:hypothetical protein
MGRFRTILVACLTLAVATLPAAGTFAPVAMANAPDDETGLHCAEHVGVGHADHRSDTGRNASADSESSSKIGYCDDNGCCGKCFCLGLTAVLDRISEVQTSFFPRPSMTRVAIRLSGRAYTPQPPPPRV